MRILALVPGEIGEQIYFFPTLETLNSKFPEAKIDVLVEPRAKKAYRVCKYVSEVLLFDYQDRSSMADYLNLLGVIRDREYDAVISYNAPWAVASLLWLNGIPVRIGAAQKKSWFFSQFVPFQTDLYKAQSYHEILQGFGIKANCPPVKINVPQKDIDWAESRQKMLDLKDGYVLLDALAETYPIASWQKIVADLQAKQPDIPVVLLNTEDEDVWISGMMAANPSVKVIRPADVGKAAGIIAGANLFVSSDRNSIALAVAIGTYTIALIESTETSKRLLPEDNNYISVTSPSKQLADIPPETVLSKIWGS